VASRGSVTGMMRHMLATRFLAALLAGLIIAGASAATAQAGETRNWNNKDRRAYYHPGKKLGYASASVTVDFVTRNAVDIRGFVDDVCPADSEGATLFYEVHYDRTAQVTRREIVNNRGCDKGVVSFDPAPYLSEARTRVEYIQFKLCSYRYDPELRLRRLDTCLTQTFKNWRR
jgi:hypothetical protein